MQHGKSLCYNFTFVTDGKHAKRYFVSGMVQGVGFRFFTRDVAEFLRLGGYVRNLPDGRVEIYAVGMPEQLAKLTEAIKRGPSGASVTDVQEQPAKPDPAYASEFSVTY